MIQGGPLKNGEPWEEVLEKQGSAECVPENIRKTYTTSEESLLATAWEISECFKGER